MAIKFLLPKPNKGPKRVLSLFIFWVRIETSAGDWLRFCYDLKIWAC
jgi:hypothetical protein